MSDIQLLLQSKIIHLFVACIAIVAIVSLFLKTKINDNSRKLHLLYVTGILVFIVIELVSYICLNACDSSDKIISYISFASTLSSLILSVVAIIYTIVSNQKGNDVFIKISDKAEAINTVSDKLCAIVQSLDSKLYNFEHELRAIHKITNDTKNVINGMSNVPANQILGADIDVEKVIQPMIQAGSILGNLALLACCYSNQKNKDFELKCLFPNYERYVYGYLIAVNSMSFISVDIKDENVHVNSVNDIIMGNLKVFFSSLSTENYDFIKNIQKIQEFFDISEPFFKTESNK